MHAIARGTSLSLLSVLVAAASAAGQIQDIRGLTFAAQVDLVVNASVLDDTLELQTGLQPLPGQPHAFDVLPDPAAPTDPGRLVIRTRLPSGPDDTDEVRFELTGTFDQATGEIEAVGVAGGLHFWQTPFATDAFGLLGAPASVWLLMRDPEMTLHAVVAADVSDTSMLAFDIVGGAALGPGHAAASFQLHATRVSWLPFGTDDEAQTVFGPYAISEDSAALTELQAQLADVFGDVDDDLLLTPADVTLLTAMLGPILEDGQEGDLTADGIVDMLDVALLQWLVRCIGNTDVVCQTPVMQGSAGAAGSQPMTSKP